LGEHLTAGGSSDDLAVHLQSKHFHPLPDRVIIIDDQRQHARQIESRGELGHRSAAT